jgi:beta-lactamase superfamily II metal-dependent hydrolase
MPRIALVLLVAVVVPAVAAAQNLEIHYINVGWGSSVIVKGPDGTTVLLEAGNTGKGTNEVVPYLKSIGIQPANGLDYMIGGHQHCDHLGGLDEVINAGYNVRARHYYNGSTYTSSCVDGWETAAATTTAGAPVTITPGTVIPLGNGATMTCVAVNGKIIGGGTVSVSDENDRSIAMLVQYGGFDWLWASDLGGGSESCTGRSTGQLDVETAIVQAISPGGAYPLISTGGIDVLNVNHHGSESSTNNNWMDYSVPAVAVVAVGAGQTTGWDLPRIDVVDNVLLSLP